MDTKALLAEARKLYAEAQKETDQTRAKELYEQSQRAYDTFEREVKLEQFIAKVSEDNERDDARKEASEARTLGRPTSTENVFTGGRMVTTDEDFKGRHKLIQRQQRFGRDSLNDREFMLASEIFPEEELYARSLVQEHAIRRGVGLSEKDLAQVDDYQNRADAVISLGETATTAPAKNTIPTLLWPQVEYLMKAYGPMADPSFTRRFNTSGGGPIEMLVQTSKKDRKAYIVAENTASDARGMSFRKLTIPIYKYSDRVVITTEMVEDTAIPLMPIIQAEMAESLGRALNEHFTLGTGVDNTTPANSKPKGIVTIAAESGNSARATTTAATAALTFNEIFQAHLKLDRAYRGGPKYFAQSHSTTIGHLAMVQDSDGRYLFTPTGNVPGSNWSNVSMMSIWGWSIHANDDMATLAANKNVMVFGDHECFITRMGSSVRMEQFYDVDVDHTRLVHYSRWGSDCLIPEALGLIKTKTS